MGISFIAGFLGGWAGLGGGVILTPMWLDLGVAQPRAAASATFCVLFTSLLSVVSVAIAGEYELQLFLVLLVLIDASLGNLSSGKLLGRRLP